MIECMRLIIGEMGARERGGGLKVGGSEDPERPGRLGGREGTAMLGGTEMDAAALLLTPSTPVERDPPSLRPRPHPKVEKLLR